MIPSAGLLAEKSAGLSCFVGPVSLGQVHVVVADDFAGGAVGYGAGSSPLRDKMAAMSGAVISPSARISSRPCGRLISSADPARFRRSLMPL